MQCHQPPTEPLTWPQSFILLLYAMDSPHLDLSFGTKLVSCYPLPVLLGVIHKAFVLWSQKHAAYRHPSTLFTQHTLDPAPSLTQVQSSGWPQSCPLSFSLTLTSELPDLSEASLPP